MLLKNFKVGEIMDYMDAERLKEAIRQYAVKHHISVSDMFEKAGNSPSTGTRFMRGVTESLNGKTIGSLFSTFRGLEELYTGREAVAAATARVPIMGMVKNLKVNVMGMGNTTGVLDIPSALLAAHGDCVAICTANVERGNYANWMWIVRTTPISLDEASSSLCYIETLDANLFGYLVDVGDDVKLRGISSIQETTCKVSDIKNVYPVICALPPSPIDTAPSAVII